MSLDLNVYVQHVSDDLIPRILKRLNERDMVCEIHPDFSFKDHSGFVPFKFRFRDSPFEVLRGKDLMSGFELYTEDFNLAEQKRQLTPKPGFFKRLFGAKAEEEHFVNVHVDKRLEGCTKMISFVWHASDSFELRFASLTSAILAEMVDGVCSYPADDIWYENDRIVEDAWKEVLLYEKSKSERNLEFNEFDGWH